MIDTKRKGRNMWCENCNKKTRHIPYGVDEKECISQDDKGRTHTGKVVSFVCEICETSKVIDRWG